MTIIVPQHKLAFKTQPDAVSDSVGLALAGLDCEVTQTAKARRFKADHWAGLEDHFRFCVVRDPIDRLMELYALVVEHRAELAANDLLPDEGRFPANPDPDYFFTYLDAYRARSAMIKRGAMGAGFYLGELAAYDRVFRGHELGKISRVLSSRTAQVVKVRAPEPPAYRLQLDDLLDETIDLLRPWIDEEYAFLHGWFDNPLGARIHAVQG